MPDDYLWDRCGGPDPFIARLERNLAGRRARVLRVGLSRRRAVVTMIVGAILAAALFVWIGVGMARPPGLGAGLVPPSTAGSPARAAVAADPVMPPPAADEPQPDDGVESRPRPTTR